MRVATKAQSERRRDIDDNDVQNKNGGRGKEAYDGGESWYRGGKGKRREMVAKWCDSKTEWWSGVVVNRKRKETYEIV